VKLGCPSLNSRHLTLYQHLLLLYKNAILLNLVTVVIGNLKPLCLQMKVFVEAYELTLMACRVIGFLGERQPNC